MEEANSNSENDTPGTNASANNAVAIDNKIEQAMDLVKTHLLYAVREEVELLKERIIELETKIARLESENKLLRQHAPVEVVQFIQQQQDQEQKTPMTTSSDFTSTTLATGIPQQVLNVLQSQIKQAAMKVVVQKSGS